MGRAALPRRRFYGVMRQTIKPAAPVGYQIERIAAAQRFRIGDE
jgi:hypothetical protein